MSIGRIMSKAVMSFGKKVNAGALVAKGKSVATIAQTTVKKAMPQGFKKAAPEMNILGKIESNTSGRILRMQEAKQAFTPIKPFATTVTKENVPTLQKINEITGVTRGSVKDATGYFNKRACADALAAFKHEPVQPTKFARLGVNSSVPTQQKLDTMLGVGKVDALKQYEQGGRATREILENRAAAREAFLSGKEITPRWPLGYKRLSSPKVDCKIIAKNFDKIASFNGQFKSLNPEALAKIKKFSANA